MLTERGERVHTGDAKNLNRLFAQSFTKHFEELAVKYPIYGELRNVFDLALVAGLIRSEDLAGQCDWQMTCFGTRGNYQPELGPAPKQVASVINHREINRKHFIVGVSGGVSVTPAKLFARRKTPLTTVCSELSTAERSRQSYPKRRGGGISRLA